jgi:hypothetical protein
VKEIAEANNCHPEPPKARGREAAEMPQDGEGTQDAQLALNPRVSAGAAHLEFLRRPLPSCASRRAAPAALDDKSSPSLQAFAHNL